MSTASARGELTAGVLGTGVAGVLALIAAGQVWASVTVERRSPLPPVSGLLSGADAVPLVPAAGLVLLAAAVALLAVRGAGRIVVGLLVAAAGGALVVSALQVLVGGVDAAAGDLPGLDGPSVSASSTDLVAGWPVLAALAGALAVGVGGITVVRGRTWPAMGRRYERAGPAPAPRSEEDRAQLAWNALDRGEDPTDDPTDPAPAPPSDRRS